MKTVILCGGLGTRLREETEFRPKPMVPVGGRPILWHIMKGFASQGHKDFILCLGYKGEVIRDYFRNYQWNTSDVTLRLGRAPKIEYHTQHDEEDWSVTLLETGEETMTGGRLARALPHISEDDFFLTYGDGLSDVNLGAVVARHRERGSVATVTAVRPHGRFGDMVIGNEGEVTSFDEKPQAESSPINGGFMVLSKKIGDYISGDCCVFESDVLPQLARQGKLSAYEHRGFWQCMDTQREQTLLDGLWRSGKCPWRTW
jgi:glucose-1-phosphate cytidylyltransferase